MEGGGNSLESIFNAVNIHLYFREDDVDKFFQGEVDVIYGYTKFASDERDTVHLSIPLAKTTFRGNGEYEIRSNYFKHEI